jgi:hypothetical protein
MLYLRLPIAIPCSTETLSAELYLPSHVRGLSICVNRTNRPAKRQRTCETLSDIGMATLVLTAPHDLASRHVIAAIDWARGKRLLRTLPINIIAPEHDAQAARKAADRRLAAVTAVLSVGARARDFAVAG